MSTVFKAPWPNFKVTSILPNPQFKDIRKTESSVQIKRTMTGRVVTYIKPSDRITLTLPFKLTRMKSLELENFISSYQSTKWHITLYDGSEWEALLIGEPVIREAVARLGANETLVGREQIETTLTFSALRLN